MFRPSICANDPACAARALMFGIAALVIGLAAPATAQQKPASPRPAPAPTGPTKIPGQEEPAPTKRIEGLVQNVYPQGIMIEDAAGATHFVFATHQTQVDLQGEASSKFYVAGAYLEFEAQLDANGRTLHKVPLLTFVEPTEANPPGLFPRAATDPNLARSRPGATTYLVRGKLETPQAGEIVIRAGNKKVICQVVEELTFGARFRDWTLASPGDQILATVEMIKQINQPEPRMFAKKLRIEASDPIAPKGK